MTDSLLVGVVAIIFFGVAAQWLAWRFHLPAILVLLVTGIGVGPLFGFLESEKVIGEFLSPFVSLCGAIILFETGLSLQLREVQKISRILRHLVTIGAGITWLLSAFFAVFLLKMHLPVALIFGAIVVVTGPAVVVPLLRYVRPSGNLSAILKWEARILDLVGVIICVLVYEAIHFGTVPGATSWVLRGALLSFLIGIALGCAGALLLVHIFRHYWVPDILMTPVALATMLGLFALSNHFQNESGLLTVVVMGVVLANQKKVAIRQLIELKETFLVIMTPILIVMLAGRLHFSDLALIDFKMCFFIATLILIVRPLSVFASTMQSDLTTHEKLMLASHAPRGVVAVVIAAIIGPKLFEHGIPEANQLIPLTFAVIAATVIICRLSAPSIARALGVSQSDPQGVLFIGAHIWAQKIAIALKELGVKVLLVDTNHYNILSARRNRLPTHHSIVLIDHELDEVVLEGIGKLFALTPNDDVNALIALHFSDVFGREEVYKLSPRSQVHLSLFGGLNSVPSRILFRDKLNYTEFEKFFAEGAVVKTMEVTQEVSVLKVLDLYGENAIPLAIVSATGSVGIFTSQKPPESNPGDKLVYLAKKNLALIGRFQQSAK